MGMANKKEIKMKKIWKVLNVAMVGLLLGALPTVAQAQDTYVSLRAEPGVAIPVGDPQDDRFGPGGAVAVKPELSIKDIFSFGPSASVAVFQSNVPGVDAPTLWTLGGFVRVKRPHGFEWNSSDGAAAASPWIDGDLQYVRTGPKDRLGYAAAAGVSWPVDQDRMLWVGPFLRYQGVYQADDLPVGRNSNDSHTLILGASFEIGEPMTRVAQVVEEVPAATPPAKPVPRPAPVTPAVAYEDVNIQLSQVILFKWDSDKLDAVATKQLDAVIAKINGAKEVKAIKIEGHASSEGQVAHNDKLSQRRANSVLEYLAVRGISREKLSAVGFGSRVPAASNATEPGRVLNRRAEFVVNFVLVQEVKK